MRIASTLLICSLFLASLAGCTNDTVKAFKHASLIDRPEFDDLREDHDFPAWNAARDRIAAIPRIDQLQAVNDFINAMKVDFRHYEIWASPRQLATDGGLCRDFAFAKHEMLAELGWSREDMRIAALHMTGGQFSGHAVLEVRAGPHIYVLDSLVKKVLVDHWSDPTMQFVGQAWISGPRVVTWPQQ